MTVETTIDEYRQKIAGRDERVEAFEIETNQSVKSSEAAKAVQNVLSMLDLLASGVARDPVEQFAMGGMIERELRRSEVFAYMPSAAAAKAQYKKIKSSKVKMLAAKVYMPKTNIDKIMSDYYIIQGVDFYSESDDSVLEYRSRVIKMYDINKKLASQNKLSLNGFIASLWSIIFTGVLSVSILLASMILNFESRYDQMVKFEMVSFVSKDIIAIFAISVLVLSMILYHRKNQKFA